jgi:hypothetical protein
MNAAVAYYTSKELAHTDMDVPARPTRARASRRRPLASVLLGLSILAAGIVGLG